MSALVLLAAVFLGIPFAIVLATPVRYLKFYLAWLVMLAVLAIVWPGGADHSRFAGFGELLGAAWLGICTFLVVVKIAIAQVRRALRPETADNTERLDDTSDESAWMLAGLTGLLAAPWSMFVVALVLSDRSSAALAHGSMSVIPIAAVALLTTCRDSASELMRTFAGALLGLATITLATVAIYVTVSTAAVIDRAEAAANGHPYCIETDTARFGYRPAVTRLDLSPLVMRGRCSQGWCFSYHGILAIDAGSSRVLMNWSYRHADFQNDVRYALAPSQRSGACEPVRGFARHLPLF